MQDTVQDIEACSKTHEMLPNFGKNGNERLYFFYSKLNWQNFYLNLKSDRGDDGYMYVQYARESDV